MQQADDDLSLSPVYSLAAHSQALWLLSGLESGGINLQSVRHDEGKRIHCLKKHTSAVSVLALAEDEKSVISGSWDKAVYDWDLNTSQIRRAFLGSGGQVSSIERRPDSSVPVPAVVEDEPETNGTFRASGGAPRLTNGLVADLRDDSEGSIVLPDGDGALVGRGSPAQTPLSEADSLFGDYDDKSGGVGGLPGSTFSDDEDDEFSRAIANGFQQQDNEAAANGSAMIDVEARDQTSETLDGHDADPFVAAGSQGASDATLANAVEPSNGMLVDGLPDAAADGAPTDAAPHAVLEPNGHPSHGGRARSMSPTASSAPSSSAAAGTGAASDTTFLAASIDGTLRIWDRRQPNPVATIMPRNVPPWCMNACWSPDGNTIYAGRRNGTVEEYSLHRGLREPERIFKFPQGSGPVSTVKAMPNGRHLVCASFDILRLYDLKDPQHPHASTASRHSTVPFLIIPGHRGGVISTLYTDPTCRYLISAAGNRGWEGHTTEVLLGYEINC